MTASDAALIVVKAHNSGKHSSISGYNSNETVGLRTSGYRGRVAGNRA